MWIQPHLQIGLVQNENENENETCKVALQNKDHTDLNIKRKIIIQEEDGKMWETSDTNLANLKNSMLVTELSAWRPPKAKAKKTKAETAKTANVERSKAEIPKTEKVDPVVVKQENYSTTLLR
jgi:hypothetical protein